MSDTSLIKTKRNGNMELLRLISMCMVVFLHGLGKGNNLVNFTAHFSVNSILAWILESLAIPAVNIFVLVSGYFLVKSKFKIRRLFGLVFQIVFYSFGVFVVCLVLGRISLSGINIYDLLKYVFPVHMGVYWFMTSYVVMYMLSPLINKAVNNLSQGQLGIIIIMLLIYESLIKSILPFRFEQDEMGYSIFWFLTVYLIGAYFRLYGFKYLKSFGKGLALFFTGTGLVFLENGMIFFVNEKMGRLLEISKIACEYNHIFCLMAAVGLFAAFANREPMNDRATSAVSKISPMALGIYLLHESPAVRYEWPKWLGIYDGIYKSVPAFVGLLVLAVVVVFALGLIVDYGRIKLFAVVSNALSKTGLNKLLNKIDGIVNNTNEQ